MDRDGLLALDKEVPVDQILRLHERVAVLKGAVSRHTEEPGKLADLPST